MRRLRGQHVYPVVTLSNTFMNTKHGGRQRPHFVIKRWVYPARSRTVSPHPNRAPPFSGEKRQQAGGNIVETGLISRRG